MSSQQSLDLRQGDPSGITNRIGNTSLVSIHLVINNVLRKVCLKLEGENPGGSVKDRTAYSLLQDLEKRGLLNEDSIIVESTSGNLGVALSLICRAKGYRFLAVVDPKATSENLAKMEGFGARIDMVHGDDPSGGYLLARLDRVRVLCRSSKKYIWTDQYSNQANPLVHYTCTGPEIYRQMHGKVDAVFAAVSTGGTLAGIGRFFREVSPTTKVIGVDATGSIIFGGTPGPRRLTGIGSARPSDFISDSIYDKHILVRDEDAFAFCRRLYADTNLKVGGSSGAVIAACAQYLYGHPEITQVTCLCADTGDNYSSTIFNDEWLQQQQISLTAAHLGPVEEMLLSVPSRYLVDAKTGSE